MTMRHGIGRRARTLLVGLLLTSGFAVRARAATEEKDDNNFREDVIVCEEAVSYAVTCCGFQVKSDACRFYHYYRSDDCGCQSGGTDGQKREDVRPVISVSESRRIAGLDCAAMKRVEADGTSECTRIQAELDKDNHESSSVTRDCR